jgi:hypothetical protein
LRNLRRHLVFAFFAAAAWLPGAAFEAAWASAWLLPPGDGQIITYSAFSDSTRAFDGHGNLIPVPDYQKFELGTYVEYGVTDWLADDKPNSVASSCRVTVRVARSTVSAIREA